MNRRITNYLDDFLFIALTLMKCNAMIQEFLDLCQRISVPISAEKTEWASAIITFLGMLLDGRKMILAIPNEKWELAVQLLKTLRNKKKATMKELQRLCEYLNFLCKAVFPGRAFVRRMYVKYSLVVNINGSLANAYQFKLKQHHHVHLDKEFKLDCDIWIEFLEEKLQNVVNRPMIDWLEPAETSEDILFYSDASASDSKGFGAILKNQWIRGVWNPEFIKNENPSIEFLELFAVCAGILTWNTADELTDRRIVLHCDNQTVCYMINNLTSSCKNCLNLINLLILDGLKHNCHVTAQYITSKDNFFK